MNLLGPKSEADLAPLSISKADKKSKSSKDAKGNSKDVGAKDDKTIGKNV